MGTSGFRPPQWARRQTPMTLVVPPQVSSVGSSLDDTQFDNTETVLGFPTVYVFDAVLSGDHEQDLEMSQIPVQTGASLTDNSFLLPARFTARIFMSDAMQSFNANQFSGNSSRSIAAFETLLAVQALQLPVQVTTRLRQYDNMLVAKINARDSKETAYALEATVSFQQIITATVEVTQSTLITDPNQLSTRPDATASNPSGATQTQDPSETEVSQHSVYDVYQFNDQGGVDAFGTTNFLPPPNPAGTTVPGAGGWSSNNTSSLPTAAS